MIIKNQFKMNENKEMEIDDYQTDITTPSKHYCFRKKRCYEKTLSDLSSQLNQMSFLKKKFRLDSQDNYLTELPKENEETETEANGHQVIDMKLERDMVSAYYKNQNKLLNKLMFGTNDNDS